MVIRFILKILLRPKIIVWQFFSLLLQVIATGTTVIIPLAASSVLDQYFLQKTIGSNEIILIIVVLFSTLLIPPVSSWLNLYIGEKVSLELKNALIKKVLVVGPEEVNQIDQSKFFTIITNDVNVVKDTLIRTIPSILMSVILLVGSVIFMYRINSTLSTIVFIVIPLITSFVIVIFRQVVKYFKKAQEIRDKINKTIDENIKASMLIKVFVAEEKEKEKFGSVNKASYNLSIQIIKKVSLVFPILNITMYVGQLIVLLVGGIESINGRLSIGEISAFNNYVIMFTTPFLILSFMSTLIGQAFASIGRINSILNLKDEKKNTAKTIDLFESLKLTDFGINVGEKSLLDNVNFNVKRGEKVGIIGMTGSGKSVFVEALLKFFNEYEGSIVINGLSAEKIDYSTFRGLIGYVPQKNFILSGTLLSNIDFYRNLPQAEINKAVTTALVDEFASKYDDGLAHIISERGGNLSGGQKQRITIARALAGNPQILIIDDSTSKLDMATESKLMVNLRTNYPGITVIIVAQKIASIKDCSNIYVMENGTFVESGSHEVLIQNSLLYQEIDLSQSNYHEE